MTIPFEIIPKGRSEQDAKFYKLMRWWIRKNRLDIETEMEKAIRHLIMYGNPFPKISWDSDTEDLERDIQTEMEKGKVLGHFV